MVKLLFYFIFFFIGAIVGYMFVFIISRIKIYEILRSERKKYLEDLQSEKKRFVFRYLGLIYMLKKRKDEYKKKSEDHYSEIWNLRKKIEELASENAVFNQESQNNLNSIRLNRNTEVEEVDVVDVELGGPKNECWFFTIPEEDGKFFLSRGYKMYDDNKFYKIECDQNSKEGRLYLLPGIRYIKAIQKIDTFLRPVCEIQYTNDITSSSKIEIVAPGRVILSNDYWIIDPANKIKIKII